VERAFGWANPIAPVVEVVASHALWLLAGLFVLTCAATFAESEMARRARSLGSQA
jgi:hypothetical protein